MSLVLANGGLVTGDGETVFDEASVIIEDGIIKEVLEGTPRAAAIKDVNVVDVNGDLIMPGIINGHTHCITMGPHFAHGAPAKSKPEVIAKLNEHLLQGTTSILSADGFATLEEVEEVNRIHPMNIKTTTIHSPLNFKAADLVDGSGLREEHRKFTIEKMLNLGAVAVGELREVESGRTDTSFEGIAEGVMFAKQYNVPVIIHNAAATVEKVLECAREYEGVIAAHSNHFSFQTEEAIDYAKELKKYGATIDILSGDSFGAKRLVPSPETTFAMLSEGLADIMTTDYMGGHHDAILLVLQKAIENGIIDLPYALNLATYKVAQVIPRLAPYRGLIAPGFMADIIITDHDDISKVKTVIIEGRFAVRNGEPTPNFKFGMQEHM